MNDARLSAGITMLAAVLVAAVRAESGACGMGTVYEIDGNGVMTFSGSGIISECNASDKAAVVQVVINKGIVGIGSNAFYKYNNLRSVIIADSVNYIARSAFSQCAGLESISIPSSVGTINSNAFYGCSNLASIAVSDGNIRYKSVDGVLFTKSGEELVTYPCGRSAVYTVPDGVKSIGAFAFYRCSGLVSISIGDSVTSIGDSAFDNCDGILFAAYCGSNTSVSCASARLYKRGRTVAVPKDYGSDSFCGCAVTKSDFACSGCSVCNSNGACKDLNDPSSLTCDGCNPGYGYSFSDKKCTKCSAGTYGAGGTSECLVCPSNEWKKEKEGECMMCDSECNGCNATNGECLKCYSTSELIDGRCIPCEDGLVSNGTVCRDVSGWSSVTGELVSGTNITQDMIEDLQKNLSDEMGCSVFVTVIDGTTVKISLEGNDENVLAMIKAYLEQCTQHYA